MKPFDTIQIALWYSLMKTDGPMSFVALENGQEKRFSQYVERGCWRLMEVR